MPLGTHGRVRLYKVAGGFQARTLVRDYDGRTRHIERVGRSRAHAEALLKEAVRDRSRSDLQARISPNTRVASLAEYWFESLTNVAPSTRQSYRTMLERNVLPGLGQLHIRELTVGTVDRHLRTVALRHGHAAAKMTRSVVSGMCGLAARHDALPRNPVRDAGHLPQGSRSAPRALTAAQARQLRALLTYDDKAMAHDVPDLVSVMLATGLRIGEATALMWDDVDLDAGTVRVVGTVQRLKDEGLIRRDVTKTRAGARHLVLPIWCVELLRARPARTGPVFPATRGKGLFRDPSNVQADLRDALRTAGFGWATSHTFRKSVATLMDEKGLSARAAADQLGHAKPSMTQDVYMGRGAAKTGAAVALEAFGI